MRRASEVSPPPVGEARIAPMPFACWRAHSSERMAEPQPERALVLAHLTLHGNGICKLGAGFNLLPDCLPGNASKSCRIKKSGTPSQVSQDKRVSPMPVHGLGDCAKPRLPSSVGPGAFEEFADTARAALRLGRASFTSSRSSLPPQPEKTEDLQLHPASHAHPRSCAGAA